MMHYLLVVFPTIYVCGRDMLLPPIVWFLSLGIILVISRLFLGIFPHEYIAKTSLNPQIIR